jgi:hypothetical protein
LAFQQESLRIRSCAAELEGPKIFVPLAFGNKGMSFDPDSKPIEISDTDVSIAHSLDQVFLD